MNAFLVKGYFDTIPKELDESAKIDGAGLLESYRSNLSLKRHSSVLIHQYILVLVQIKNLIIQLYLAKYRLRYKNTLIVASANALFSVIFVTLTAYAFSRYRFVGRKYYFYTKSGIDYCHRIVRMHNF
jgi:ABC-type maltose transport system permease subunit